MASITPGFTFNTNGLPTKSELQKMARSLVLSGIDLADVEATTLGVLTGLDSGSTGAFQGSEQEGMMWVDPESNLWVQEMSGPVMLKRYGGGWETRRYFVREQSADPEVRPGAPCVTTTGGGKDEDFDRTASGDVSADGVRLTTPSTADFRDAQSGRFVGYLAETGASEFARWCGRGFCQMIDHGFLEADSQNRATAAEMQNDWTICGARDTGDTTGRVFHKRFMDASSLSNRSWQGWIGMPGLGATLNGSNYYLDWYGYNFGMFQQLKDDS